MENMHAEMSEIAVINHNNNFAPSLFWSFCEIINDCFGASVFFFESCAPSENYLSPNHSSPNSYDDLKKDGVHLLLSK